jgi:hypothetical protein
MLMLLADILYLWVKTNIWAPNSDNLGPLGFFPKMLGRGVPKSKNCSNCVTVYKVNFLLENSSKVREIAYLSFKKSKILWGDAPRPR